MIVPRFIYYHIPKCGGTTARFCIYRMFKDNDIFADHEIYLPQPVPERSGQFNQYHGLNLSTEEQFNTLVSKLSEVEEPPDFKALLCHVTRDVHHTYMYDNKAITMTILRNPVDRLVSHYNHFHHEVMDQPHINDLNYKQLKKVCETYQDVMCNYLVTNSNGNMLNKAIEAIHEIDFVYILENAKMESICEDIFNIFNTCNDKTFKPYDHYDSKNVRNSKKGVSNLTKDVIGYILDGGNDMKLYKYAKRHLK